jgi:hypothetical protein
MKFGTATATVERQIFSRFRTPSYWVGAVAPVVLISLLLFQAGRATGNPAMTMFLAVLSALWIGGSGCVREIVDERRLIQRDPHVSLFAYAIAKILHAGLMAAGQSFVLAMFVRFSGVVFLPLYVLWPILFLTTLAGCLMALLLSALCDEASTALAWFPLVLVPQVVFGGFLFPFGATHPFALDSKTAQVIEMPPQLTRRPVTSGALRVAGAFAVSRWAFEGYAAQVYEQDLSDQDAMLEAVKVNALVPITLGDQSIADRLYEHFVNLSRGVSEPPPTLDAHGSGYLVVLALFVVIEAVLLVVILPIRDPRRA